MTHIQEKVPDDRNLFSEVPSLYPNATFRVSSRQDIPRHMAQQQFVPPDQQRNMNGNTENLDKCVQGANMGKYFRKPASTVGAGDVHATM